MGIKTKFTVGEMARLHNIPAKTLRYYDGEGVFRPAGVNRKNGYREYEIGQFETLNCIKFLRRMGWSLKDIRSHLRRKDPDAFREALLSYREMSRREIRRLQQAERLMSERLEELDRCRGEKEFDRVRILRRPARPIRSLAVEFQGDHELEWHIRSLENKSLRKEEALIIGRVGLRISRERLLKKEYGRYSSFFILEPDEGAATLLPAGEYARVALNRGDRKEAPRGYALLEEHIRREGYRLTGDSIERVVIDSFLCADPAEHLMEIEVPVAPDL